MSKPARIWLVIRHNEPTIQVNADEAEITPFGIAFGHGGKKDRHLTLFLSAASVHRCAIMDDHTGRKGGFVAHISPSRGLG